MTGIHNIDRSDFAPGQYVTTSLGPDRQRWFEIMFADRNSVRVRDPSTGRQYQLPLEHVAVVDLDRHEDHVDDYRNDRRDITVTTTAKLANAVAEPSTKQVRGRPDSNTNLVRKRIKTLQAANPYSEDYETEAEDPRPRKRDAFDFLQDWRE